MNTWVKLGNEYLREIKRFYKSLNFTSEQLNTVYKGDGDTEYLEEFERNLKDGNLDMYNKLHVIRNVLSKKIKDKKFLKKICLMILNDDKEMDNLSQLLIEEKLKAWKKKKISL